jgi:murein L,D-transpeptidase YcbB/YkuD
MSPAGACGLMGNMNAESAMKANNAQDGMTRMSDTEYTAAVDNGSYANFVKDAVGYGLCQWTYWTRKQELLNFAKSKGVSIGNEDMQVDFAIKELKRDNASLWKFLCSTTDIDTATSRICKEYERPAVNNITVRVNAAKQFYNQFSKTTVSKTETTATKKVDTPTTPYWPPRVLAAGMKGADVMVLQALLTAHGYEVKVDGIFGSTTTTKLKAYQKANGLTADGIAGDKSWAKLLSR